MKHHDKLVYDGNQEDETIEIIRVGPGPISLFTSDSAALTVEMTNEKGTPGENTIWAAVTFTNNSVMIPGPITSLRVTVAAETAADLSVLEA